MTYLKLMLQWILEGKYLFIAIILICFTAFLDNINLQKNLVDSIRIYGLLLQLFGTIIILIALRQKIHLFRGHGLFKFLTNYLKRFPISTKPKYVDLNANFTMGMSMSGEARAVKRPTEDIKDIIRYFEEEIQYLHQRIAENKSESGKEFQDIKYMISSLKGSLESKIHETKQLIIKTSISDPWFELLGILCFSWGLILGTIPDYVKDIFF